MLSLDRLCLLAPVVALSILGGHFWLEHEKPLTEVDEAAVIYSTGYFDLFFSGRFGAPEWKANDAIDHPPAWKYLYGAALALAGRPRRTLAEKERWLDWVWDGEVEPELIRQLQLDLPSDDLFPARLVSFLALATALGAFFALAARATSRPAAAVAVLFLAFHGITKWVSARALIDGPLLLLIVLSASLTRRWLERGPARGQLAAGSALGLGVCLGVLAETKITGIVGVLGAALALGVFLATRAPEARQLRPALLSFGLALLVTAFVAVAINPSLWSDPIGFALRMASYRAEQLRLQMILFDHRGFVSTLEGLRRFAFRALLAPDPFYRVIGVPLVAFGAALGAARIVRIERGASPTKLALLAQLGIWTLATIATYRLDWPRYVLPALPLLALFVAVAVVDLAQRRVALRPALAAAAFAILILVVIPRPLAESDPEARARREWAIEVLDRALTETSTTGHKHHALAAERAKLLDRPPR